jgi:hypothetical protein
MCAHEAVKDSGTILNAKPTLLTVLETLARLDGKKHDCFLTVTFVDDVELGDAQALARILSTIDSEKGVRIQPPPAGQLYYKAFTPDPSLLDRDERIYHPWELSLSEKNGQVEGTLVRIDSIWKEGSAVSELEASEARVSGPEDLRKALDAEAERTRKAGIRARPPVILAFAPATLPYGMLLRFLAPVLLTHKTIHVYLDAPMPTVPPARRKPPESP